MLPRCAALLTAAVGAAGHGVLTLPHGRQGGTLAGGGVSGQNGWYTDDTSPRGMPTNCQREMRTVRGCQSTIHLGREPWGSPGAAGVLNACGGAKVPPGEAPCKGCTEPFAGGSGSELPKKKVDVWKQGAHAKVAWGIAINHGGGYAYRLCPTTETPTEACFQKHHLQFADPETSVIHWGNGTEVTIPSRTLTTGTVPAGSAWKRNPIPLGGPGVGHGSPIIGFKPPCDGCNGDQNKFSIVDLVQIPYDLPAGDYLISWRWDTEETPQVWVNCGDVTIVAGDGPAPPAPAPSPPAADKYGCVNGQCVADPAGVPRATCAAVCHS